MGSSDYTFRKWKLPPYPRVIACILLSCLLLLVYSYLFKPVDRKLGHVHGDKQRFYDDLNKKYDISDLKKNHLFPPSKEDYNLSNPSLLNPSMGQAQAVAEILKEKRNGFFIECGGLDGETRSNTLYFEKHLGWSGLVIEGDPLNFRDMVNKRRKSWISDACLSLHDKPEEVLFKQQKNIGKILQDGEDPGSVSVAKVKCFPLHAFAIALNINEIDYFSLDVEGNEFEVLQTIPFDKLTIKTLSVEFAHDKVSKEEIASFMSSKGYYVHSMVTRKDFLANDFIFVKKDITL